MTYLDDPQREWKLEHEDQRAARWRVRMWMRDEGSSLRMNDEAVELVVLGAAGLLSRGVTDDIFLAMDTALVWYYG